MPDYISLRTRLMSDVLKRQRDLFERGLLESREMVARSRHHRVMNLLDQVTVRAVTESFDLLIAAAAKESKEAER